MPTETTEDSLFHGKVSVQQYKNGYRFSIDAVLLAGFVNVKPGERLLDPGCGCGVIPLILAQRYPELQIMGCELQKDLAALAQANIRANKLDDRVHIIHGDMRDLTQRETGGALDVMVCNPPFYPVPSGRVNRNTQKAFARHEIGIELPELLAVVKSFLKKGGRFYLIYPAGHLARLLGLLREFNLESKKIRMVHSTVDASARLTLVCAKAGARAGLTVEAPLVIHNTHGRYTPEVQELFKG